MTKKLAKERSERLLKAAAKLFREKGFALTTVREIAAAAKILPGSLHYRYPTKEAILVKLMDDALERATSVLRQAVGKANDPAERLKLAVKAHLELLLSGDDSIYILLYGWRSLGEAASGRIERLRTRYEALWDSLLYEAVSAGCLSKNIDLKLIKQMVLGALNWVVEHSSGLTPDELTETFWMLLSGEVIRKSQS
ncbi:MAG: TetR/AcrR family transcriptional regulator [Acidobacteriota bacterium]|nr:TetR/AcrR family transcriptional regulator [Blastocatellia bacterium]MDW8412416.1 TetR/AcrR family transcriptional regulator [Acidobacteriota bacterium]